MVGVVDRCAREADAWNVEVTCRNRARAGALAQVLSPGEDVRTLALDGLERWDDEACTWRPAEALARTMGRYRMSSPWPLSEGDLICVEA